MICSKCGKETGADARNCPFCGQQLPETEIPERGPWERAAAEGHRMTRKQFILLSVIAIAIRVLTALFGGPSADEVCVQDGAAHLKQGNYSEAFAEFDKAIGINPKNAKAYTGRAQIYVLRKAYDKAIADYDRVIALTGELQWHIKRGAIFRAKGDYEQALVEYDKGLEDSKANDNLKMEAYWGYGIIYENRHNFAKAVENFTKAIEVGEVRGRVYFHRGRCHYKLGGYEEALADFTEAAERAPHIDDYKLYRANVLKILGRFDEAEEIMKQVKKIKT